LIVFASASISSCKGKKPGPPPRESSRSPFPAVPHDVKPGSPVLPGTTRLDGFLVEEAAQGWGNLQLNLNVTGNPLSIAGQGYSSGLGTHAVSRIKIKFEPRFKIFSGLCGVDDWVEDKGSVIFTISNDGKTLFKSPVLKGGMKAVGFAVPVQGLSGLLLLAESGDPGINSDHADWVNLALQ
jgi:hypothetical protein